MIDYQIENGTDGLLLLGTTSESESLTFEEKVELVEKCTTYIDGRVKVIVGLIDNKINEILNLADKIKNYSFNYYLVGAPFYVKSNETGLVKYFTYLADNLSKPLIIYNVPKRSGININIDVIKKLSFHKNIIGIKESSGDICHLLDLSTCLKEEFKLFCGDDFLIIPSLSLGASGIISVIGNAYPKEIKKIYDNFYINIDESRKGFFDLWIMINDLFLEVSPIPIKYLLYLMGFETRKLRMPLDECSKNLKRKIEEDYLNLEFLLQN